MARLRPSRTASGSGGMRDAAVDGGGFSRRNVDRITRPRSGEVHRKAFEIGERAVVERAFVRSAQHHVGGLARLERFLPTRRAQAPAVARLEAGKAELRHRRRKIIAAGFGKGEEIGGHDDTNRVAADVLARRVAAAVAKEARHWFYRADFEPLAEHVAGGVAPTFAMRPVIPQHLRLRARVADTTSSVRESPPFF